MAAAAEHSSYIQDLFLSCTGSADGVFGVPQLRHVLQSLGSEELGDEELASMMVYLDRDGDGRVSMEDFQEVMGEYLASRGADDGGSTASGPPSLANTPIKGDGSGHDSSSHARPDSPTDGSAPSASASSPLLDRRTTTSGGRHSGGRGSADSSAPGSATLVHGGGIGGGRGSQAPSATPSSPSTFDFSSRGLRRFTSNSGGRLFTLATPEEDPTVAALQMIVGDLLMRAEASDVESQTLMQAMEEFVEERCAAAAKEEEEARSLCEQAERRCAQLKQENKLLGEEFQRLELELSDGLLYKKQAEDRLTENEKLRSSSQSLQADLQRMLDQERQLASRIEVLESENDRLTRENEELTERYETNNNHLRTMENERDTAVRRYEQLAQERTKLLKEYSGLSDALKQEDRRARSQMDAAGQLQQENEYLRDLVAELRASLQTKEESVLQLRMAMQEQNETINSLRNRQQSNQPGHKGSIMNEIEDLVMSQIRSDHGDIEQNNEMTLALLQQLLPGMTETEIGVEDSAPNSKSSSCASLFSPDTETADGSISPTPADPRSAVAEPIPESPPVPVAGVAVAGPAAAAAASATSTAPAAKPTAPVTAAATTAEPLAPNGAPAKDTGGEESSNTTEGAAVSAPPARDPATNKGTGSKKKKKLKKKDGADKAAAGPDDTAEEAPEPSVIDKKRLGEYARFYAASTQHMAGLKIITMSKALRMSVSELEGIKSTLLDLIRARGSRLIEALDERDNLRHEKMVKERVIVPVITLMMAGEIQTPRLNASGTGFQAPQSAPVSPARGSRKETSTPPLRRKKSSWFSSGGSSDSIGVGRSTPQGTAGGSPVMPHRSRSRSNSSQECGPVSASAPCSPSRPGNGGDSGVSRLSVTPNSSQRSAAAAATPRSSSSILGRLKFWGSDSSVGSTSSTSSKGPSGRTSSTAEAVARKLKRRSGGTEGTEVSV